MASSGFENCDVQQQQGNVSAVGRSALSGQM